MRDPDRISEVLKEIERIWRLYPDWRLGQLITNAADWAEQSVWDLEEDVLLAEIRRHLAQSPRVRDARRSETIPLDEVKRELGLEE